MALMRKLVSIFTFPILSDVVSLLDDERIIDTVDKLIALGRKMFGYRIRKAADGRSLYWEDVTDGKTRVKFLKEFMNEETLRFNVNTSTYRKYYANLLVIASRRNEDTDNSHMFLEDYIYHILGIPSDGASKVKLTVLNKKIGYKPNDSVDLRTYNISIKKMPEKDLKEYLKISEKAGGKLRERQRSTSRSREREEKR